jgi:hypothetical protein
VLLTALRIYQRTGRQIDAETLAREASVDDETLQLALAMLYRKGYFEAQTTLRGDDRYAVVGIPTDAALRAVAEHQKSSGPRTTRDVKGMGGNIRKKVEGP